MLNSAYIVGLEAKWKRWKIKRYLKLFFSIILFFLILISSWYAYFSYNNTNKILKKDLTQFIEKEASLKDIRNEPPSVEPIEQVLNTKGESKQPELSIQTVAPSKKLPYSKKSANIPEDETISLEPLYKPINETNSINRVDTPIDLPTSLKKPAKIHIDIQPASSNTTKYLKDKFDSTGNVIFALMIADEYYSLEEYDNALRWALTANEMNPKNERSWILFAMSKAKLNRPEEGILALEEYLKTNNSGKIESLLINLKRGTF